MDVIEEIAGINQKELEAGILESALWHSKEKDSARVCMGGLPIELIEGDVICARGPVECDRGS
jgi:RNA-binding motif X-linked protein 2